MLRLLRLIVVAVMVLLAASVLVQAALIPCQKGYTCCQSERYDSFCVCVGGAAYGCREGVNSCRDANMGLQECSPFSKLRVTTKAASVAKATSPSLGASCGQSCARAFQQHDALCALDRYPAPCKAEGLAQFAKCKMACNSEATTLKDTRGMCELNCDWNRSDCFKSASNKCATSKDATCYNTELGTCSKTYTECQRHCTHLPELSAATPSSSASVSLGWPWTCKNNCIDARRACDSGCDNACSETPGNRCGSECGNMCLNADSDCMAKCEKAKFKADGVPAAAAQVGDSEYECVRACESIFPCGDEACWDESQRAINQCKQGCWRPNVAGKKQVELIGTGRCDEEMCQLRCNNDYQHCILEPSVPCEKKLDSCVEACCQ